MAGSGFDLGEGLREGLRNVGERLVEIDRSCKAYFGLLPNSGVVAADDVGNYANSDDLRELISAFKPGYILSNGTSLSKSGDDPITLISGDSVTAERVREIMITLQIVDSVARRPDGASPLGALLAIAEAGGRVDVGEIGRHDKDVLTRYGLGKESRELQWSEVRPSAMLNVPFLKSCFIVDPDVVAVVKSGVVVDSNGGIVLRNPERPERDESFEKKQKAREELVIHLEKTVPPNRVLFSDESVLTQTGNNPIDLRQWYANPLEEGQENSPWGGFRRLTEQQTSSIKERFGPLSEQLPSEQVRSIALRLEILVSASENSVFSKMYDHIVEGEELSRETALLIESLGLGKAFYRGSSKPETNLGIQFEKGVVEVLLAGARWFHNSNDPFLGITNPEHEPNP